MDWLPKHKCEFSISHNENRNSYQSITEWIDLVGVDDDEWVSMEEKAKAIETDSLWVLHWYPDAPVGFCRICASSLDAIQNYFVGGTM